MVKMFNTNYTTLPIEYDVKHVICPLVEKPCTTGGRSILYSRFQDGCF